MPETTRRGARGEGPSEHLSHALLDGYFAGESSAFDLLARSVPHLAARCPGCAAGLPLAGFERALASARERARVSFAGLAGELEELPEVLSALVGLDPAAAFARVATDRRFATVAFAVHQSDVAAGALADGRLAAAAQALALARQAALVLDPARYGVAALRHFAARRWLLAARIEVARPGGRAEQARSYLAEARQLAACSGEPPDLAAEILRCQASVYRLEGDLEAAITDLAAAATQAADAALRAEAIVEAAVLERLRGRPAWGAERLERLLRQGGGDDLPSPAAAQAELVRALGAAGCLPEAEAALLCLAPVLDGLPGGAPLVDFLEGGLAARHGAFAHAETALVVSQVAWLEAGYGLGAALALTARAQLYAGCGARTRLGDLVRDVAAFAGCEDLGGGALGALVRFILGAARGNDPGADGAWRLEERLTRGRLLAPAGAHDDGAA